MNETRILVVDDDVSILDSLRLLLEDEGYDVATSAKNGDIVDALIKSEPPDLIILDILLSGHDGSVICKRLKSQDETKGIPIVLISAHPNARAMSLDAGADSFLAKPFDVDELL